LGEGVEFVFCGGPDGFEEAAVDGLLEFASVAEGYGAEKMQLFLRAGGEDVEETFAFGVFAGFFGAVEPLVEVGGFCAFAGDGG
jgi:hypothetical protein